MMETLSPNDTHSKYSCPCGKLLSIPLEYFDKKNPFEFTCPNCNRRYRGTRTRSLVGNTFYWEIIDESEALKKEIEEVIINID